MTSWSPTATRLECPSFTVSSFSKDATCLMPKTINVDPNLSFSSENSLEGTGRRLNAQGAEGRAPRGDGGPGEATPKAAVCACAAAPQRPEAEVDGGGGRSYPSPAARRRLWH